MCKRFVVTLAKPSISVLAPLPGQIRRSTEEALAIDGAFIGLSTTCRCNHPPGRPAGRRSGVVDALARAGRLADGWIGYVVTPAMAPYEERNRQIERIARDLFPLLKVLR